jgi:hypothetical protein
MQSLELLIGGRKARVYVGRVTVGVIAGSVQHYNVGLHLCSISNYVCILAFIRKMLSDVQVISVLKNTLRALGEDVHWQSEAGILARIYFSSPSSTAAVSIRLVSISAQ